MELTSEIIEAHKLPEEAVKAINSYVGESVAEIKKEYEGKANENAEKIISGTANYVMEKTGVKLEREKGEKLGDYLTRVSDTVLSTKQGEIEKVKADYEEKIKGVKGSETLSKEYEALKVKLDDIQKKYADYDEIKTKADQYEQASEQLTGLKRESAFNSVKPVFPETANPYEVDAKWNAFKNNVLKEYDIELVDGKYIAISKENQHKQKPLSELLEADKDIQGLKEGRKQTGLNGNERAKDFSIDGVPFKIQKDATGEERQKAIQEYLIKEKGMNKLDPNYAKQYSELNSKILQAV